MGKAVVVGRHGYAGLFLVTLATLMYEILLTRIFSATMWYHFAFVAISVAMFGMTVGAIVVYLAPSYFVAERARHHLGGSACLFGVSVVVCFLTQLSIPFIPDLSFLGMYSIALTYIVVSIPFIFSGVCVCLALTKFPRQVSTLYAADLAGAAFGCIAVIYTLKITDALTAMFVAALFGLVGAWFFALDAQSVKLRRVALIGCLFLAAFAGVETALVRHQKPLLRLRWVNGVVEDLPLYERWNSFSRLRVYRVDQTPPMLNLLIDTSAATGLFYYDGTFDHLQDLKHEAQNLCHYLRPNSRVLVVGSGGGKDILAALMFGQKSVLAVEINEDILDIVNNRFGDFTGHLDKHPKVTFVNDEARSYVTGLDEKFDILQISLIDTWAATATGAFVLSENSLYTVEAWKTFIEHLSPDGLLTLARWYFRYRPGVMYRMTSLAVASLRELGIENPSKHIAIVRKMFPEHPKNYPDGLGVILVSRSPFSDRDLAVLEQAAQLMPYEIVLSPRFSLDAIFAQIASGQNLDTLFKEFPIDITPSTDDRPFFFHMLRPRDVFHRERWDQGIVSFNMKAVVLLAALLATVIGLTLACIVVPLVLTAKKTPLRGSWPFFLFFASIGLGFMLVEISQLQRLIIFLGHPTYGLSAVLFTLLLSSGLGSYLTWNVERTGLAKAASLRLSLLLCALVVFGILTPTVIGHFQGSATMTRILVGVIVLFPLGLFMGMAFPLGMKLASSRSAALTPWLWGINGATSICASVLAVAIALAAGISVTFWTAFGCYVVATLAFVWANRGIRAPSS
ncbi:hypothetical protein AMJ85_03925 [candidate division BRC1 bacterium SM23_51]|nr:MAG: hypothetical protein AMJ85_03925 [candidate division BRC1 bacterium SM23_51]